MQGPALFAVLPSRGPINIEGTLIRSGWHEDVWVGGLFALQLKLNEISSAFVFLNQNISPSLSNPFISNQFITSPSRLNALPEKRKATESPSPLRRRLEINLREKLSQQRTTFQLSMMGRLPVHWKHIVSSLFTLRYLLATNCEGALKGNR